MPRLDFHTMFDLIEGKIGFDTDQLSDPYDSATMTIKYPGGSFNAPQPFGSLVVDIPKLTTGVYWWGGYELTLAATFSTGEKLTKIKKFNLTPPDCVGLSNEGVGTIQLQVDCRTGQLIGRGFSGYPYQGVLPVDEAYDLTRLYPAEAERAPQTGITVMPFVLEAFEGENIVKGTNRIKYDLPDNYRVVILYRAQAKKTIHCNIDFDKLWAGVQNILAQLRSCEQPTPKVRNMAEINALLWTVTAGAAECNDVSDEVERLESLLGVDCNCQALNGTKVTPPRQGSCLCPQVTGLQASFDENAMQIITLFNTNDISSDYKLRFSYQDICGDPSTPADIITSPVDVDVTGSDQQVNIPVLTAAMFKVSVSVVKNDGTMCPPVQASTNNPENCTGVVVDSDQAVIVDDQNAAILHEQ